MLPSEKKDVKCRRKNVIDIAQLGTEIGIEAKKQTLPNGKVVVLEVAQGKAVYLSSRGPNYLIVAIAEVYAHTNSSVSLFQLGDCDI